MPPQMSTKGSWWLTNERRAAGVISVCVGIVFRVRVVRAPLHCAAEHRRIIGRVVRVLIGY